MYTVYPWASIWFITVQRNVQLNELHFILSCENNYCPGERIASNFVGRRINTCYLRKNRFITYKCLDSVWIGTLNGTTNGWKGLPLKREDGRCWIIIYVSFVELTLRSSFLEVLRKYRLCSVRKTCTEGIMPFLDLNTLYILSTLRKTKPHQLLFLILIKLWF